MKRKIARVLSQALDKPGYARFTPFRATRDSLSSRLMRYALNLNTWTRDGHLNPDL